MKELAIGVDIGGSHIKSAAVDLKKGKVLQHSVAEMKIDNKASSDVIFESWGKTINKSISTVDSSKIGGIGFAMPGAFNYKEGIAYFEGNDKYENLYGQKIEPGLKSHISITNVPYRFHNDASCFGIGEDGYGVSKGFDKSVSITLGTGFGSAFIEKGIPIVVREDVPQEGCLWHLPFKDGIADDYFSTRWFVNECENKIGARYNGVKEIASLCQKNEAVQGLFRDFGENMGNFMGPWLKKFGAKIVVVGGNVSGAFDLFSEHLYSALNQFGIAVKFQLSVLKEDAALIGSARLIDDRYFEKIKHHLPTK